MGARIDYVRIRLAGDQYQRKADISEWEQMAANIVERHGFKGKPYDDYMTFDRITQTWSTFFNVWGPSADMFYHELTIPEFGKVTRLDYRVDLTNDALDIEAVAIYAIANSKNKGLSYDFHGGRVKSKRRGRDTGGPSLSCGAKDTNRRISLYKRGHEQPGVEAQVAGTLVKTYIKNAYDNMVSGLSGFHAGLEELLRVECDKLCRERLLHPLEAFDSEGEYFAQSPLYNVQERAVEQISLLWELLDLDTREKIESNIKEGLSFPYVSKDYSEAEEPGEVSEGYYEGEGYSSAWDDDDAHRDDLYTQEDR